MQLSYLNLLSGEINANRWGLRVSSIGLLRETLKAGLCCSTPTPQPTSDISAAAGTPFAEEVCLPWEGGGSAMGSASQVLSKAFFSPIEVSLCQYNRGISAAPALRRGSWASCQSQYRPWKKRQHQAPSLELCMRRSAYPNLRFPEGTCPGTCMELAPSCACSTRPCPSRMPGPTYLPLWSAELSNGVGGHTLTPGGASLGE